MADISETELNNTFLEGFQKETPFFVFSKQKIIDTYKDFKKHFPESEIQYAMKANSEPELLQTLSDIGSGFEVASIYELHMLQKINVSPDKIIYGSAVKPINHIKEFFDYGVDRFAFDSLSELEKIASIAPNSKVYVRVGVNDAGSVFKFSEKFGTNKENIIPLLKRAVELGLKPYGISFHVGSQASNEMAWANAIKDLHEILEHLKELGIEIEVINLGGGYPCNKYTSTESDFTLEDIAKHTLAEYKKLSYHPKLILEPGRAIVAESAVAVATVIGRIERSEHTWLFLDMGVYNGLFETMAYQGSTRYKVTSMRPSYNVGESMFALAGPTGDSPDIITREVLLPSDISVGDRLVIHDVGAYSTVCTSSFNGFPKPDVYFV